eukprot:2658311-Pyramimonas_sp.AAC.1
MVRLVDGWLAVGSVGGQEGLRGVQAGVIYRGMAGGKYAIVMEGGHAWSEGFRFVGVEVKLMTGGVGDMLKACDL